MCKALRALPISMIAELGKCSQSCMMRRQTLSSPNLMIELFIDGILFNHSYFRMDIEIEFISVA